MENGFDEIWEFFRNKGREDGKQEGISIGEKRGIFIGENKRILKCILGFQKKANCSFDEAADALGVSKETLEQLKTSGLVKKARIYWRVSKEIDITNRFISYPLSKEEVISSPYHYHMKRIPRSP